jgi:hypothetical protein
VDGAHKPALVFRWLERERLVIVYQGSQPPSGEEWQAYLEQLRNIADVEHRALVYSEHHISRKEQDELKQATTGSAKPRVALISPSTAVRFVASIFTLLNRNVRFFAPSHFDAALAYLACDEREAEVVTQSYQQLRAQVLA